jgi:streptomycin 6-kinase
MKNKEKEENHSYYNKVKSELNIYAEKWALSQLEVIDDGKASCVLKAVSKQYGSVILKKRETVKTIEDEFNTLSEYNGRHFCKVYEVDLEHGILLEEQVQPGTELIKETSLDQRLKVFCSIYKELHIEPSNPYKYPTYYDWVNKIATYMQTREDHRQLCMHMKKAEEICKELISLYPRKMLLHGDLHHYNILQNDHNGYTLIDPKGVIGDPIFDLPRFLLNEMEDEINQVLFDKINHAITVIGDKLGIPTEIIKKTFYIEMAMAECWRVEDGEQASLERVIFAEKISNTEIIE